MTRSVVLVGVLVAAVVTAAFWFLLYAPQNEREATLRSQIDTVRAQEASLRARVRELREVQRNEVEISAALARLEELIPVGPSQPSTLRQLQSAADRAGVDIEQVAFGEPVAATLGDEPIESGIGDRVLASIPTTISLDAGYFQIVDFLRRLETEVPRAVLVEDITFEESPEGEFPTLRASLVGQVFALVDPTALPPTAGVPPPDAATGQEPAPGAAPSPSPSPSPSPEAG